MDISSLKKGKTYNYITSRHNCQVQVIDIRYNWEHEHSDFILADIKFISDDATNGLQTVLNIEECTNYLTEI